MTRGATHAPIRQAIHSTNPVTTSSSNVGVIDPETSHDYGRFHVVSENIQIAYFVQIHSGIVSPRPVSRPTIV